MRLSWLTFSRPWSCATAVETKVRNMMRLRRCFIIILFRLQRYIFLIISQFSAKVVSLWLKTDL